MSVTILWPTNTTEITDAIRDAIGRPITIYTTVSGIPCSACSLDPITNLSIDPFCSTCDGLYWTNTESGITVSAHVSHRGLDTPVWQPAGTIVEGGTYAQFKYSAEIAEYVKEASYYEVDGRRFLAKKVDHRGVPQFNRIVVILEEQEN